jgi:hypothetical protein
MPVNYDTATKTLRMQAVRDQIDSGPGPGTIEICTAGFASVLLTFTLSDPGSTVANDVLTLTGMPKTANASAAGTAAVARIKDSTGTVRVNNLTVGTSGADVIISNTAITNGASYSLTAGSINHAA